MSQKKQRLDELLLAGGHAGSRREAEALIISGKVQVNDTPATKPGHLYPADARLKVKKLAKFVSRGGIKLECALKSFDIDPGGWVCADIGASSGGFTDCLLQYGAAHVYAVDVAYGQLDWKLRSDSRVTVLERINARNLTSAHINRKIDLAVFDTSFISLEKVIPPLFPFFKLQKRIIALIKPQFELSREKVGNGGIVRDEDSRAEAIEKISSFGNRSGLTTVGVVPSAIKGPKGNQEYLIYFLSSE